MGKPLTDQSEILFRQIHPSFYQDGVPSKKRFMPQPKDGGSMSVDRGSLTSAAASHALYVSSGRQSAAVFGLSVGEFLAETLPCFEDPLPNNTAHALVNYGGFHEKDQKLISIRLWLKATQRGSLFPRSTID